MKLPILKSVCIENLSLFTNKIEYDFQPGINMVIGGNGIGKTTLVYSILFALVGNFSYKSKNPKTGKEDAIPLVEADYFKGRIKTEDQENAKITLTIQVDNIQINILRSLYRPKLLSFNYINLSDNTINVFDNDDELEKKYIEFMEMVLDVEFENFVFLVANLLLFDG